MENIVFSISKEGVAEISFDVLNEKVNVLSSKVMMELDGLLDEISKNGNIKTLVFKSAKKDVFIAGADIREIALINTEKEALEKSSRGQDIMNKIENLPFPTIAVINGACLGGGLELALSCSYRIVTDNKKVQIGLPETTLGLIPGFGGTVRLPRLAGLSRGLELIMTGKSVDGMKAYKYKIADAIFPEAFINEKTVEFIRQIHDDKPKLLKRKKKRTLVEFLLEGNPLGRNIVFNAAKKNLMKKTRGVYPAPLTALETVKKNFKKNIHIAVSIESANFSKIAMDPVSKNMVKLYFMNEDLKKANQSIKVEDGSGAKKIKVASVLGAGKMGGGIAWLLSNSMIETRMKDISWEFILSGYKSVKDIFASLKKIGRIDAREMDLRMSRISSSTDYAGISSSDLVIEAIVEDRDIKRKTISELESFIRNDAIIVTNTSSISVNELAEGMKHPERFAGFHFFNPVNRMPLIEIVKGKKTSESVIKRLTDLAVFLKKTPIVINDCNGFLVNRILMSYLNEALLIMEEGVDFDKIDKAIYDFGFPMGPFTLLDEIGIKVGYKVANNMLKPYSGRFEMGNVFPKIAGEKNISGRSSGSGFFIYNGKKKYPNKTVYSILGNRTMKNKEVNEEEIVERCILRMINESAFCLDEKIIDKAEFLDLALIYGIGFPPFLGGLLHHADSMGIDKIISHLAQYESRYGSRFTPSHYLIDFKNKGRRFYP
jgi:3-hydroxyacyl-CoA dehydrogenase/enoyl-CoA hydratase/3-hydroxybutyryl-CoA epimerase